MNKKLLTKDMNINVNTSCQQNLFAKVVNKIYEHDLFTKFVNKSFQPNKLCAELHHSARLGKTFPVGWVGGWLAEWVRKAEIKAKAQHSWDLGFANFGEKYTLHHPPHHRNSMSAISQLLLTRF